MDNLDINKVNKNNNIVIKIVVILIMLSFTSFVLYFMFSNKQSNKKKVVNRDYSSLEKIKFDYDNSKIDVSEYFKQLVYLEYDYNNLNPKYKNEKKDYITNCNFNTEDILDEYFDKLDKDVVKYYLINKMMTNVYLGEKKARILRQANKTSDINNHVLDGVYLSPNGKFLIWYAKSGNDSVSFDDIKLLGDGLENTANKYESYFGVKYSYSPYIDNKYFNEDYKSAKEVLSRNGISVDVLKSAMSVYVYDTGSNSTLASYNDEHFAAKLINRSLIFDILDNDGVVNYPYMVINKKGIASSRDSLVQLYNHELFHHFQQIYCKGTTGSRCVGSLRYMEGMANFASAKVSQVSSSNNFLNRWATVYTKNTSNKLLDIADRGGSVGYALFPYLYSYHNNNANWNGILMSAHNQRESFSYIKNSTGSEELKKTINELAYRTLSQKYDNNNLVSYSNVSYKRPLNQLKKYDLVVNAGGVDYYELSPIYYLEVIMNNPLITAKIYGYKNGSYTELKSSNNSLNVNTASYNKYEKIYLVIANGDILNSYDYSIQLSKKEINKTNNSNKDKEYNTSYKNYNVSIDTRIKIKNIEITTTSTGVIDELHQKQHLNVATNSMGISSSQEMYVDLAGGYTYMTKPNMPDTWWKDKQTSSFVDIKKILDKLMNMKDVQKISDNKYKIKLDMKDASGVVNSTNSKMPAAKGDIYVVVYTKDGKIKKLEYDFSSNFSSFDLFITTIEISNYNNAGNVTIPNSIISSAKNMDN